MTLPITLSKKTFNSAVTRMKAFFDNDRKKAAQALSQGLYAEDYNVVASKLNSQPKTAKGALIGLDKDDLKTLAENLKDLRNEINHLVTNEVFFVNNATNMRQNFDLDMPDLENRALALLLNEIETTILDIKKYNNVTRLSVQGFHNPVRYLSDFEREYCINAELKTENLLIKWNAITIENSDYEGNDFKGDAEDQDITVNGIHWLDWLKSFQLSDNDFKEAYNLFDDFATSIAETGDAFIPELNISAELALMLKKELL